MPGVDKLRQDRARDHREADPQAWEKHLVQGADVDHAGPLIQALQRGQWPSAVAKFAVVVVLDDPGARLGRPRQQFQPARHGEHRAGRILMRRRDHRRPRLRRLGDAGCDHEPMLIDRYGTQLQAGLLQAPIGHRIAGVLDPDLIPGMQQGPHGDVDGVLRAGGDDHLVGIAAHRPRRPQIVAHGRTQLRQATRIGVTKVRRAQGAHRTEAGAAPGVLGAGVHHAQP